MDFTNPHSAHVARAALARFLRDTAPSLWSRMFASGIEFTLSPTMSTSAPPEAHAVHLAAAERERLSHAELYHIGPAATEIALTTVPRPRPIPELLPSPAGLVVWARPIARVAGGGPVVAALWGPSDMGSTWISWWSDTAAAAAGTGRDTAVPLSVHDPLAHVHETLVYPNVWPSQVENDTSPVRPLYRGLFGTWQSLADGTTSTTITVDAEPDALAAAAREGLRPRPVRYITADPAEED